MTEIEVDFTPPKNRFDIPLPVPGPEWKEAPVECYESEGELGLLIGNLYFTAHMFHMLPEHSDWKSITRGDIAILGRADLDWHMLDLVLMDDDGYLKSASISFLSIWKKPQNMRTFLFRCWNRAPLVLIHNNPYQRSTTT